MPSLKTVLAFTAGVITFFTLDYCILTVQTNTCLQACHPQGVHAAKRGSCVCVDPEGKPFIKEK